MATGIGNVVWMDALEEHPEDFVGGEGVEALRGGMALN
jgi:hypothetical protein